MAREAYLVQIEDIGTDECNTLAVALLRGKAIDYLIEEADIFGFTLDRLIIETTGSQTIGGYIFRVKTTKLV